MKYFLFPENFINPEKCTWENKKFLCSNNHTCIDIHQVCDGKHQCPDQSDESILCSAPTHSCSHHNCSHTCVQLPTGPKCYCPEGYHNINDKECQDINECEIYGEYFLHVVRALAAAMFLVLLNIIATHINLI